MSIVDEHALVYYKPTRLAVQRNDDGSFEFFSDIAVYNAAGKRRGDDHPTPQVTPAQEAMFETWWNVNIATYEAATELTPLPEPE